MFACYRGNAVPIDSLLGLRIPARNCRHYSGWSKCGKYRRHEYHSRWPKCGDAQRHEAFRKSAIAFSLTVRAEPSHTAVILAHRGQEAFATRAISGAPTGHPHSCFAMWLFNALRVASSSRRKNGKSVPFAPRRAQRASTHDCQSSSRGPHDPKMSLLMRGEMRDRSHSLPLHGCSQNRGKARLSYSGGFSDKLP